jgi:beta-glucanase (GH16 family)
MTNVNTFPFILAALLLVIELRAAETVAPSDGGYQLVWADEFDQDGPPNPDNWTYEHGFVRNDELQWYQEKNATCRDGLLVIEARKEHVKNERFDPDSGDWRREREFAEYTSACLLTRGKHEWKCGRFAMRAKIDVRPGLWPAFWTLGSARGWPGCGEIDVMEYYAGDLLANLCWQGRRGVPAWDSAVIPISKWGANWANDFHLWQLEWTPQKAIISIDGEILNETDLKDAVNEGRRRSEPFQEPHYLLLNLAIGGTRGGDPATTEFPAKFEVDYVRVYQLPEPAASE